MSYFSSKINVNRLAKMAKVHTCGLANSLLDSPVANPNGNPAFIVAGKFSLLWNFQVSNFVVRGYGLEVRLGFALGYSVSYSDMCYC